MGKERTRSLARKPAEADAAKGKTPDKTPAPAPKSTAPAGGQVSKLPSPATAARMIARAEERGKATPPAVPAQSEEKKTPVQKKVAINEPGDKFEKEADSVASRVKRDDKVPEGTISRMDESASGVGEAQREAKAHDKEEAGKKSTEGKLKDLPVQRASTGDDQKEKLKQEERALIGPVQRAANGGATMEDAAEQAIASKGAGQPLVPETREKLERRMGADLSDVRVHDDSAAQGAARDLNARAFTHGSDIWLGGGESQRDVGLMAHEVTHVMQQTGSTGRALQRAPGKPGKAAPAATPPTGPVDLDLPLPVIKSRHRTLYEGWASAGKLVRPAGYDRGKPDQKPIWMKAIKVPDQVFKDLQLPKDFDGEKPAKLPSGKKLAGTYEEYVELAKVPKWDRQGKDKSYQVDHMIELQVAEKGSSGPANTVDNLELFDARANTSSGSTLKNEIREDVSTLLRKQGGKGDKKEVNEYLADNDIRFPKIGKGAGKVAEADSSYWTRTEIEAGLPFKGVEPLPLPGKAGGPRSFALLSPGGALVLNEFPHQLNPKTVNVKDPVDQKAVAGLVIKQLDLVPDYHNQKPNVEIGSVTADWDLPKHIVPKGPPSGLKLFKPGVGQYSGALQGLPGLSADVKGMSALEFKEIKIRNGELYATGVFTPSIPLFGNRPIEARLMGRDVEFAIVFTSENLSLPVPGLTIDAASVAVFMGTKGIGVEGGIQLSVERLGKGSIDTRIDTKKGFSAEGRFDFDSELFDQAEIAIWYREGAFGGEGTLAITTPGKIKGIKGASISAKYDKGVFSADGKVQPSIPGVKEAGLSVVYSEKDGLEIGGQLALADDIPGIQSGSVDVKLKKLEEGWKVKATGKAVPKIPGVAAEINISYDDGAFDIVGTAAYQKGMLSGALTIGATNRPVGEDGNPAGAPPEKGADKITLYGGGSLSLKIAPWLQATATVKLKPNGEIEVTGRIGLPSVLEIFPEKRLDKNLFKVGIDIPIVGVSVAGQRIGIFANITGGLDLSAGIGPGQLQDLHLEVTYNPDHEDQTHVSGAAKLHVPAQAGLRMFVRGSLGVGIPIVSASAGLEIGGGIGLEGALDAGVNVDWTPTTGIDIQASAEIYVQPKLRFDITGFVLVEADLFISTIELYSKRWQLAAVEYGSDLKFGLKLPIHYQEGKPFDISFSDVEFITPSISAEDVLAGLLKKIA